DELESSLKEQPESYLLIGDLALTEMKLGENTLAMALADRGLAVNPIEKDAATGPLSLEVFARVTAATGDHDRSIATLKKLLSIPYEGPLATHLPLTPARSEEHTSELQSHLKLVCRLLLDKKSCLSLLLQPTYLS